MLRIGMVWTTARTTSRIELESGAINREYRDELDQKITTVCGGWTSRGVAIGEGKVFLGQLDGRLKGSTVGNTGIREHVRTSSRRS
jgi:quinohemoprotein ethanol dehydrogenase